MHYVKHVRLSYAVVAPLLLVGALHGRAAIAGQSAGQVNSGDAQVLQQGVPIDPDYKIGPGDSLNVFVWRNPELSVQVPVRPDGKISTPLVDDMLATGKSPSQLARDLEQVLSAYIRSPTVNVIVTAAVSTASQVRVVGQAVSPRSVAFHRGLTVIDAVIAAGGLGQFAAGNRAKVIRTSPGGKATEIKVRLKDLIEKGDVRQNLPLQPGDILVIPETRF